MLNTKSMPINFLLIKILPVLVLISFLIVMPYLIGPVWLRIVIYTIWIGYLCVTWNIVGMCGLFSLMHTLFIAAGAYTSTLLWMYLGISPWVGMIIGGVVSAIMALVVSYSTFRANLPVLGFAIFTMGLSVIATFIVISVPIGGYTEGLIVMYSGTNPLMFQFESTIPFYFIILCFLVLAMFISWYIQNSKIGLFFRAIHDNEVIASAAGVNVVGIKLFAMCLSAFLTAIAGSFWAQYYRFIGPELVGPHMVITIILLVVIGGMGTLWGPLVGTILLIPATEYLRQTFTNLPGIHHMIYGGVVVIILITLRQGIVSWITELYIRRKYTQSKCFLTIKES